MLKSNQGIAMVVVLVITVLLLSITGGALLLSGLNLKTANNLKTGGGAIYAADAGIQHALSLIPTGSTFSYSTDVNSPTSLVPATTFNGYSYTVTATNDSASTGGNTRAILISEATGPNNSVRKVRAYIGRSGSSWLPPAALYFAGTQDSHKFFDPDGKSFLITGDDTNYDGTTPSSPAASIPGIATNDAGDTTDIINSLSSNEKPLVKGQGYSASPLTPSVQTVATTVNIEQLATDLYNQVASATTCPPKCTNGLRTSSSTCPTSGTPPDPTKCILGTDAAPQITYIREASDHIHLAGKVTGSGILVLEGKVHIQGDFNFHGLVVIKEPTALSLDENDGDDDQSSTLRFKMKDRAKVFGSVLVGPNGERLRFDIKNQVKLYYSSAAMSMVNSLWGSGLPQPAKLIAWNEVMQ